MKNNVKEAATIEENSKLQTLAEFNLLVHSKLTPNQFKKIFNEFSPIEGQLVLKNDRGQITVVEVSDNWLTKVEWLDEEKQWEEEEKEMSIVGGNPEVETHIDLQEGNEVYRFMRNKFDEIADSYNEDYDAKIAEMASEHFGITSEEAGDIYTRIEDSLKVVYRKFAEEARNN